MARATQLNQALKQYVRQAGIDGRVLAAQVIETWPAVVGPQVARVSSPERFEKGVLHVRVRSGAWAQQLSMAQQDLVRRYRDALGRRCVVGIRFFVGSLSTGEGETNSERRHGPVNQATTEQFQSPGELSPEQCQELEQWEEQRKCELQGIKDEELRQRLATWIETVRQKREALLRVSGHRCARCGAVMAQAHELCPSCRIELDSAAQVRLRDVLTQMPWLSTTELANLVPGVDEQLVASAREELGAALAVELKQEVADYLAGLCSMAEQRALLRRILLAVCLTAGKRPGEVRRADVLRVVGPQASSAWAELSEE